MKYITINLYTNLQIAWKYENRRDHYYVKEYTAYMYNGRKGRQGPYVIQDSSAILIDINPLEIHMGSQNNSLKSKLLETKTRA